MDVPCAMPGAGQAEHARAAWQAVVVGAQGREQVAGDAGGSGPARGEVSRLG